MLNILLQAGAQNGGSWSFLIMMGLVVIVMYVFMILPQMRKQKQIKKFREELNEGSKIVTIGGLHAKIVRVHDDNTLTIESENTKLRLDRTGISMEATQAVNAPPAKK